MKGDSKYKVILCGIFLLFTVGLCIAPVSSEVNYPQLRKYVSDEANLFSSSEIMTLNDRCAAIEKSTGIEIAIVTVQDTGGQDVIQYAAKTGELNGVGSARTNDGIVLLYSLTNQPGWAIATGRGAESTLTDAKTSQFLRDADSSLDSSQYFAGTEIILTGIQNLYGTKDVMITPTDTPIKEGDRVTGFTPDYTGVLIIVIICGILIIVFWKREGFDRL